ncbi:MAG: hypothetical protein LBT20_07800 [Clostridiales bacterium]|jgi:glutamyl-tRNA reductase|nr:hypothetical protein [Clostridiales bacterium]
MTGLVSVGISHKTADLSLRERVYLTEAKTVAAYARLMENKSVRGALILSTCNRTELYLSAECDLDAVGLFFNTVGESSEELAAAVETTEGGEALRRLFGTAAGLLSRIFFEDQILGQVKAAAELAAKCGASDNRLKKAVQLAVTYAKRLKTEIQNGGTRGGIACLAVKEIENFQPNKKNPLTALIIGSGVVGLSVAGLLAERGYLVSVTKRAEGREPPNGVGTIGYSDRYRYIKSADVIVGATKSPHTTLKADGVIAAIEEDTKTRLFLDLAVPRDFDREISDIRGAVLKNIEDLQDGETRSPTELEIEKKAAVYAEEYIAAYEKWTNFVKLKIES